MRSATALDTEDVVRLRAAMARISRELRAVPAGAGLTPTQLAVLGTLGREGPLRLGDLATAEAINPTMLSRIVGKLEAGGFLQRVPDPDDGRAAQVQVTTAGRRRLAAIRRERTAALGAHLAHVDPGQLQALVAALPALEALADLVHGARA